MAKRKDKGYRVWFDRGSAIASGVGAALFLTSDQADGATEQKESLSVLSEWNDMTGVVSSATVSDFLATATKAPVITATGEEDQWTKKQQQRFHALAVQEAQGQLSREDAQELEVLSALRRGTHCPRSGDEVLWEYQQRRLTQDLLESLSRYVDFYEEPGKAWTSPGKNTNGR